MIPQVQLQTLTAVVKLFLKKPDSAQGIVQQVLEKATKDCDSPDVRDRAYIYWRLLSTDPAAAKAVVLAMRPPISLPRTTVSAAVLEELLGEIGSLASVYHKPAETFIGRGRIGAEAMQKRPLEFVILLRASNFLALLMRGSIPVRMTMRVGKRLFKRSSLANNQRTYSTLATTRQRMHRRVSLLQPTRLLQQQRQRRRYRTHWTISSQYSARPTSEVPQGQCRCFQPAHHHSRHSERRRRNRSPSPRLHLSQKIFWDCSRSLISYHHLPLCCC